MIEAGEELIRNPMAVYVACKAIDNYRDVGTTTLSGARVMTYFGHRTFRQFFYEPLWQYDLVLAVARANGVLADAYATGYLDHAVLGFAIFKSAHTAPAGRLQLPAPGERLLGGHAVSLAGWDDDGESLVFANSWGRGWGNRGFGTISREYWKAHILEAWVSRFARWGPSPFTWDRLESAHTAGEYVAAWKLENPRWRQKIRFGGYGHQLMLWETISWTGHPVEVLEIRDGRGLRVAWSELFFEGNRAVVKEFFVWPDKRLRGYGTLLEGLCTDRARARHSSELVAWLHMQDAFLSVRRIGREFASRRGYEWRWTDRIPRVVAVGHKPITTPAAP
jgi:hypothetical protein